MLPQHANYLWEVCRKNNKHWMRIYAPFKMKHFELAMGYPLTSENQMADIPKKVAPLDNNHRKHFLDLPSIRILLIIILISSALPLPSFVIEKCVSSPAISSIIRILFLPSPPSGVERKSL